MAKAAIHGGGRTASTKRPFHGMDFSNKERPARTCFVSQRGIGDVNGDILRQCPQCEDAVGPALDEAA